MGLGDQTMVQPPSSRSIGQSPGSPRVGRQGLDLAARLPRRCGPMDTSTRIAERTVQIPSGGVSLPGILGLPEHARGAVLFAHGSGSGRLSPRNNAVARVLQDAGLATL